MVSNFCDVFVALSRVVWLSVRSLSHSTRTSHNIQSTTLINALAVDSLSSRLMNLSGFVIDFCLELKTPVRRNYFPLILTFVGYLKTTIPNPLVLTN